jgi:PT repeat
VKKFDSFLGHLEDYCELHITGDNLKLQSPHSALLFQFFNVSSNSKWELTCMMRYLTVSFSEHQLRTLDACHHKYSQSTQVTTEVTYIRSVNESDIKVMKIVSILLGLGLLSTTICEADLALDQSSTTKTVELNNETAPFVPASGPIAVQEALILTSAPSSFKATTRKPTRRPSESPTLKPTNYPTLLPTKQPTHKPSSSPSKKPSRKCWCAPTKTPVQAPSCEYVTPGPSVAPAPLSVPSGKPTLSPTITATVSPTNAPTQYPLYPITDSIPPVGRPSVLPTAEPSRNPTTQNPTANTFPHTDSLPPVGKPSFKPSLYPITDSIPPVGRPSELPTIEPFGSFPPDKPAPPVDTPSLLPTMESFPTSVSAPPIARTISPYPSGSPIFDVNPSMEPTAILTLTVSAPPVSPNAPPTPYPIYDTFTRTPVGTLSPLPTMEPLPTSDSAPPIVRTISPYPSGSPIFDVNPSMEPTAILTLTVSAPPVSPNAPPTPYPIIEIFTPVSPPSLLPTMESFPTSVSAPPIDARISPYPSGYPSERPTMGDIIVNIPTTRVEFSLPTDWPINEDPRPTAPLAIERRKL